MTGAAVERQDEQSTPNAFVDQNLIARHLPLGYRLVSPGMAGGQ
jgi:hypothetical protein